MNPTNIPRGSLASIGRALVALSFSPAASAQKRAGELESAAEVDDLDLQALLTLRRPRRRCPSTGRRQSSRSSPRDEIA